MFETILVGADLSLGANEVGEASRRALAVAKAQALASGAHVRVVHATRQDAGADFRILRGGEGQQVRGRDALEAAVAELREGGVEATLEMVDERADRGLLAASGGVDLVIVGKREHFNFNRDQRTLGAVAMRLLRRAPCPVWTVGPDAAGAPRRILAATDRGEAMGDVVVKTAATLARLHGAELHVLHACHASLLEVLVESEEALVRELDAAMAEARAELAEQWPDATIHVDRGQPTRVIVEAVERLDTPLVVLGTVSRRGLADVLVGNTAERLFGILEGSMLTLKP